MDNAADAVAQILALEQLNSLLLQAVQNPNGEVRDENGRVHNIVGLISRGADVNAVDQDDNTVLMLAAKSGNAEIVSLLLQQDEIDVEVESNGIAALIWAAENGHAEVVTILLNRAGINVNLMDENGDTVIIAALMAAILDDHVQTVAAILDNADFDINTITSDGNVPLILAAENGFEEIISLLLDKDKIDINLMVGGRIALISAAENGQTPSVLTLLNRDQTNVNEVNEDGDTALSIAANRWRTETVNAIITHTALAQRNNGADWQVMVETQLNNVEVQNQINQEAVILLAVVLPEGELRDSILTNFNSRNPQKIIKPQDNNMMGAGLEAYNQIRELRSWQVRYLSETGLEESAVSNLADQEFFHLINDQQARQKALARDAKINDFSAEYNPLTLNLLSSASGITHPEIEDTLETIADFSSQDLYKLKSKIIENSKEANEGLPSLKALSLVTLLQKLETQAEDLPPSPPPSPNSSTKTSIEETALLSGEPNQKKQRIL